jgi:type IV secretion system protein VirB2
MQLLAPKKSPRQLRTSQSLLFLRQTAIDRNYGGIGKKSWTDENARATFRHITAKVQPLEVPMIAALTPTRRFQAALMGSLRRIRPSLSLLTLLILFPALALAQSPFDTGFTAMQTLFTGTVAKVASLIAIVVGGYQFAHGEPGAKKTLAGVAAGTGIAVLATNVLTWLWGV